MGTEHEPGERAVLLTGKTVLVVEPEAFAAYALERRMHDLDAERVIVLHDAEEAALRVGHLDGHGDALDGADVAVIDMDESTRAAGRLADLLHRRNVKVVGTSRRETLRLDDAMPTVAKPYGMVEIERAIGRHYGVLI